MSEGWIGVDLDGTLAKYDEWRGETHIGEPIPLMVDRVKKWLSEGVQVKIFTARATSKNAEVHMSIQKWCITHIGVPLMITSSKDYGMIELWDDRCVQVIPNTGMALQEFIVEIEPNLKIEGDI